MILTLGALIAGILTTLAPCVLPLLPVIVGGSLGSSTRESRKRALIIAGSLGVSVILFTLLLRATTALIGIPQETWQWISGGILIALGAVTVFPKIWDKISTRLSLQRLTNRGLSQAQARGGVLGSVLTGAALGPVFSSCSPFYGFVVVSVLPASFAEGMLYLIAYVVGLCGTLLLLALLGQRLMGKARWLANPDGVFRRVLGIVFVLVGIAIILGLDKDLQTWLIEFSPIRPWELDSGFIPQG